VKLIIKGGRQEVFPLGNAAVDFLKRVIGKRAMYLLILILVLGISQPTKPLTGLYANLDLL